MVIHPALVHFPIGLFITALACQLISVILKRDIWQAVAIRVYVLAVLTTPLAVLTGLQEQWEYHLNHPVVNLHRNLGLGTLFVSLISLPLLWFLNKTQSLIFQFVFLGVLVIVAGLVSAGGFIGGRLVYEYGIGIHTQ